jgi:hypothetical protein
MMKIRSWTQLVKDRKKWSEIGEQAKTHTGWAVSGFLTAQPFDLADSPRELHHTQSPGKQQISTHTGLWCQKKKITV